MCLSSKLTDKPVKHGVTLSSRLDVGMQLIHAPRSKMRRIQWRPLLKVMNSSPSIFYTQRGYTTFCSSFPIRPLSDALIWNHNHLQYLLFKALARTDWIKCTESNSGSLQRAAGSNRSIRFRVFTQVNVCRAAVAFRPVWKTHSSLLLTLSKSTYLYIK